MIFLVSAPLHSSHPYLAVSAYEKSKKDKQKDEDKGDRGLIILGVRTKETAGSQTLRLDL